MSEAESAGTVARTHYETLGVHVESSADAIRRAWRLAAWATHPDLQDGMDGEGRRRQEEAMMRLNEAYQVLSDPARRRRYDLEQGLLEATCGRCGQPGRLRLHHTGGTAGACDTCWERERHVIAL